jgi:exocyst complex component 5
VQQTSHTPRDSPAGPLTPKPYIRTFESALTRLEDLREQVLQETKDVDKNVKFAENQFVQKNRQLEETSREINSTFTSLQSRISEVGKTAITIGTVTSSEMTFNFDRSST